MDPTCRRFAISQRGVGGPVRGSDLWTFRYLSVRERWSVKNGVNELVTLILSSLAPRVSWVLVEETRNYNTML